MNAKLIITILGLLAMVAMRSAIEIYALNLEENKRAKRANKAINTLRRAFERADNKESLEDIAEQLRDICDDYEDGGVK